MTTSPQFHGGQDVEVCEPTVTHPATARNLRRVALFEGFPITWNEDGFFWQEGGYFDTLEECRADIHDWNMGEAEPHEDTPCLNAPWWATP